MATPWCIKFDEPFARGLSRRRLRLVLEGAIRKIDHFCEGMCRKQGNKRDDESDNSHYFDGRVGATMEGR